ncbi:MAG: hypothetical protein DWQ34_13890 [Planctomycetota bacterium]|nr:MAG: hypothetical protein DWQ34_13890 [Planctomycetota bacterium]REK21695.1 MAG: hypothetical protein DWQ41_20715 [Planctomycetota bacterium]REK32744.1 MAG: hypothetical protein DWQ45_16735 [Planctomycetota bacterium]
MELAGSKPNPDPASGTVWVGAGPFGTCGGDVSIALLCVADAHCAFKLDVDFTGCAASVDGKTPDSCECDANTPLNVVFDNIPVAGCCNAGPPEEVKITITE